MNFNLYVNVPYFGVLLHLFCFVVIKPAFKVGEVVVWDRNLYIEEAYIQLNNPTYYHKLSKPSPLLIQKKCPKQ